MIVHSYRTTSACAAHSSPGELAYNLWWTWNPEAQRLFSRIDTELWERVNHNPVLFLRQVERARLNAVMNNRYYLDFYDRIFRAFDQYIEATDTWFSRTYPEQANNLIAYFSMSSVCTRPFPSMPAFRGSIRRPRQGGQRSWVAFCGGRLFYTEGYFSQRITEDGWQEAHYDPHPFNELPVFPLLDEQGKPIRASVELPGREVFVRLWQSRLDEYH